jgi:hypothetical protein
MTPPLGLPLYSSNFKTNLPCTWYRRHRPKAWRKWENFVFGPHSTQLIIEFVQVKIACASCVIGYVDFEWKIKKYISGIVLDRPRKGDGPPIIHYFFLTLYWLLYWIDKILAAYHKKVQNFPNSKTARACTILSKTFNPFFPIGCHLSRIYTKEFGKAANGCLQLSRVCVNPKNMSPNKKRRVELYSLQNSLAKS